MKKSRIMTMLLALLVSMASYAQSILGTVIDENGEPVIGAKVKISKIIFKSALPMIP